MAVYGRVFAAVAVCVVWACAAWAQQGRAAAQIRVDALAAEPMVVTSLGEVLAGLPPLGPTGRGQECQMTSQYPSESFEGGTYFVQAGFVENEIAAVSYVLDPSLFPVRIDLVEALIGTAGTSVPTTTEWTILVWDGRPNTGQLVGSFSSDDIVLPHVQIPPGPPQAVNLNFLIDPSDPNQVFVTNASGQNTISIGLRIDQHHNQTGNGCLPTPPENSNAFPMTDTNGANQTGNWIRAIDCGILGVCPPGWSTFQQFPALCRPSGDWMIRATWTSFTCTVPVGACCLSDGTCDSRTAAECQAAGGLFRGNGTVCSTANCPAPVGACCLSNGNCLSLRAGDCSLIGGQWQGAGSACNGALCPIGAACLPDGSCIAGVTELEAEMLGGTFLGVGTTCNGANCPQPRGACCLDSGSCLLLTQADCALVPNASWLGMGSICDSDGDGLPVGGCVPPPPCRADVNADGQVSPTDFSAWVGAFNARTPPCDQNGDGLCTATDFSAFVANFNAGCP
jgi:hypothetical protein